MTRSFTTARVPTKVLGRIAAYLEELNTITTANFTEAMRIHSTDGREFALAAIVGETQGAMMAASVQLAGIIAEFAEPDPEPGDLRVVPDDGYSYDDVTTAPPPDDGGSGGEWKSC